MDCPGCGSILINYSGDPNATGEAGNFTEPYYDKGKFSQPTGLDVAGFGNGERNFFRRPPAWNVDLSLFKAFPIGRFRPEFRMDFTNIFNHVELGRAEHDVHVTALPDVEPEQRRHDGDSRVTPHAARIPVPVLTKVPRRWLVGTGAERRLSLSCVPAVSPS